MLPVLHAAWAEFNASNGSHDAAAAGGGGGGGGGRAVRNFFRCPFEHACGELQLGAPGAGRRSNCSAGHSGLLCGVCEPGFEQAPSGCVSCEAGTLGVFVAVAAATAAAAVVALLLRRFVKCNKKHTAAAVLWVAVAERVWPRLKQSLTILLSNYQIVGLLTASVELGAPFGPLLDVAKQLANAAVDAVPAVACVAGGGHWRRLAIKCSLPLVLLLAVSVATRLRVRALVRRMPIEVGMVRAWRVKVGGPKALFLGPSLSPSPPTAC